MDEDFEFEEEDYGDNEEEAKELHTQNANHPQQWWSAVNKVCNDVDGENEEFDGFRSESDLESIHSERRQPTKEDGV